jgi:hypothetical protein
LNLRRGVFASYSMLRIRIYFLELSSGQGFRAFMAKRSLSPSVRQARGVFGSKARGLAPPSFLGKGISSGSLDPVLLKAWIA